MLEKFISPKINMYPIEAEIYWRIMRQHKLYLLSTATALISEENYFPISQYSYYRLFLDIGLESKYWVPTMVINDIDSIYDYIDPTIELYRVDSGQVERILSSIG